MNDLKDIKDVHEYMRRRIWVEVYIESIKQTGSFLGADTDAKRALRDFDEVFKSEAE